MDENKLRVYIPIILLFLASLACAAEEKLGTLPSASGADCSPTSFTLRGETDHIWEADVIPGSQYTVTVIRTDSDLLVNHRSIGIVDGRTIIVSESIFSTDIASVTFTAPQSGHVKMSVASNNGELGEYLGIHTIMICEDNSEQ